MEGGEVVRWKGREGAPELLVQHRTQLALRLDEGAAYLNGNFYPKIKEKRLPIGYTRTQGSPHRQNMIEGTFTTY